MHATLYERVLSGEMKFVTNPPVPIWTEADGGAEQGMENDDARRRHLLNFLNIAIYTRCVDQIRAWNDRLVYQCAWRKSILGCGAWGCTWSLEFPGVREWAIKVRGIDAPWHGYYEVDELPAGSSVIGQTEVSEYNRYIETLRAPR